ncbi:flavin reductase family protein [Granulicoccus phenolivorans]|uniref:flavin reductase family protein n=1 Tax=Granulicoccus phenolivorans TaxID=266854 RepID=UPI0004140263|nr:flavin reductase [Granulicoccus phenolivorans]
MGPVTIHSAHPFLPPPEQRDQLRRFRGRLAAPVTVWTTGVGRTREGWTLSSVLVADGGPERPAEVLGLLDEDTDLADALTPDATLVVNLLDPGHTHLADAFARLTPAPGGPFRVGDWTDTAWGPRLAGASWLGARVRTAPGYAGWALLVRAVIEHVEVVDQPGLVHWHGRYRSLSQEQ